MSVGRGSKKTRKGLSLCLHCGILGGNHHPSCRRHEVFDDIDEFMEAAKLAKSTPEIPKESPSMQQRAPPPPPTVAHPVVIDVGAPVPKFWAPLRMFEEVDKRRKRADFHLDNVIGMINKDYFELATIARANAAAAEEVAVLLESFILPFERSLDVTTIRLVSFDRPVAQATLMGMVAAFGAHVATRDPQLYSRALMNGSAMLAVIEKWIESKTVSTSVGKRKRDKH